MDHYWNEEATPNLRDDEAESWEFRRDASGGGRFAYSKRSADPENYRVMGGKGAIARKEAPSTAPRSAPSVRNDARPNRYNASVKMVAGDSGPAPWEWESVNYLKMPVVGEVAAGRYDVTIAYHEPGFGPDADY